MTTKPTIERDDTMNTTTATPSTDHTTEPAPAVAPHRIHRNWLILWAFLTTFAAPDLTFVIGAGQPTQKGHLAARAVPWYNAMHRIWLPLAATAIIGVTLAPLAFGSLALFIGGLSWMAHIALDRAAGYGLRNPDGSRNQA